jgi:hypothetical protein
MISPNLGGKLGGYTPFELLLSAYIIVVAVIASALIYANHHDTIVATTPNYAAVSKQDKAGSRTKPKSDPIPTKYIRQTVSGHDFKVSLIFDPNSYAILSYTPNQVGTNGIAIPGTGGDAVDIIGNPIGSSNQIIISVTKNAPGTALLSSTTDPELAQVSSFPATIMREPYTVYGNDGSIPEAMVNIKVGASWYAFQIQNYIRGGANGTTPINTSVEQIIMNSIEIE